MVNLVLFWLALSLFHFVYQSMIAPELRFWLTCKLTDLRDEARLLEPQYARTAEEQPYAILLKSIDTLISELRLIRWASFIKTRFELRKNPAFLERAESQARILDDCTVPRIRELRRKMLDLATQVVAVNSIPCATLFIAPWVLGSLGISAIRKRVRVLALFNESEFERVSLITYVPPSQRPQTT